MTTPESGINIRGAVDLSALANPAPQGEQPTGDYVVEATAASFSAVVEQSQTVPVVIELYSARSQASMQLSATLSALVQKYAGKFLLARVNADNEPDIAAAFGVQAIPATVAVVKTQPIPLFQGAAEESQITQLLDEVLRVAAENGVTGTLEGAEAEEEAEPEEEPLPENIQRAYDAIEAGDYAAAEAAFKAELAVSPADADAKAGVIQVQLLARLENEDLAEAITEADSAEASDMDKQLLAADAEMSMGMLEEAFGRVLSTIKVTAGEERETARERLVELFSLAPQDSPEVAQARKDLALALF